MLTRGRATQRRPARLRRRGRRRAAQTNERLPRRTAVVTNDRSTRGSAVVPDGRSTRGSAVVPDGRSTRGSAVVPDGRSTRGSAVVSNERSSRRAAVMKNERSTRRAAVVANGRASRGSAVVANERRSRRAAIVTSAARVCAALGLAALTAALPLPAGLPPAEADAVRDRQKPILDTLAVPGAWKLTKGRGATVAVVDTGVDATHADLKGAVVTGPNFLMSIDRGTRPKRLHGTGMASMIAGRGHGPGRGDGVIGVAPQSRILAIRAIADEEDESYARYRSELKDSEEGVGRGIRYAADHGADVINLSLGSYESGSDERKAIGYAIAKGVVVVSAVGNDGNKRRRLDRDRFAPYSYPAAYPGVIAVAATDSRNRRAAFSNRNYSVLVAAPGTEIPTAQPGGEYFVTDGTSDSSALVSGVAALIRSRHPKLPPALVAQALLASTRNAGKGAYDPQVGFGVVNAERALHAADRLVGPRPESAFGKSGGQRFGSGEEKPIAVVDRPLWVRPVAVAVVLVGLAGAGLATATVVLLHRRAR